MIAQLILASASPRRQELLQQIGVSYIVHPIDLDETAKKNELPEKYVKRMAAEKSAACINKTLPILAADTSVVIDGQILGKPEDQQHAEAMLTLLSGKVHTVYSAISLRCPNGEHFQALSQTAVKFRTISAAEIQAYWQTGEPQGKAGAYAIQGLASIFVESISGSFSGVVGLPLYETAQLLSQQGINVIT